MQPLVSQMPEFPGVTYIAGPGLARYLPQHLEVHVSVFQGELRKLSVHFPTTAHPASLIAATRQLYVDRRKSVEIHEITDPGSPLAVRVE